MKPNLAVVYVGDKTMNSIDFSSHNRQVDVFLIVLYDRKD